MAMATLAGVAHDDLKDAVMTGWEYRHDDDLQRQSYDYSRSLNSQMAGLSSQARLSSASDMVAGYRAAGLNPAAAAGSSFGSVSAGGSVGGAASPAYHSNSALGKLALEEQKYRDSERDLMAAQAENLRADAAEKMSRLSGNEYHGRLLATEFRRTQAEDASIAKTMEQFYIEITQMGEDASPVDKAIAQAVSELGNDEQLNQGSLRGIKQYLDYYGFNYQTLADNAENAVRAAFNKILIDDKKYTQAEADKILLENQKYIQDISYLGAQMALAASNIELNDEQKTLIQEQVKKVKADIINEQHSDVVWLARNDKKGLAIKTAYDAAQAAATAAGFAAGAKATGAVGAGKAAASAGKSIGHSPNVPKNPYQSRKVQEKYRYGKDGKLTSKSYMEMLSNGDY